MAIKAISFDLDDTLWENRTVIMQAEQSMQQALATRYSKIALQLEAHDWQTFRQQVPRSLLHDVTSVRQHVLRQAGRAVGYSEDETTAMVDDVFAVFLAARSRVQPFDDVLPTLKKLANHYQLIALTNGNADVQATILKDVFVCVITPALAGQRKPDPAMFHLAEEQLQLPSEAFVHVGDDWQTDVQGAHSAGWQPIWFNPLNQASPNDVMMVPNIMKIAELPEAIAQL